MTPATSFTGRKKQAFHHSYKFLIYSYSVKYCWGLNSVRERWEILSFINWNPCFIFHVVFPLVWSPACSWTEWNSDTEAGSGPAAVASRGEAIEWDEAKNSENISDSGSSQLPSDLPAGSQRPLWKAAGRTAAPHVSHSLLCRPWSWKQI